MLRQQILRGPVYFDVKKAMYMTDQLKFEEAVKPEPDIEMST